MERKQTKRKQTKRKQTKRKTRKLKGGWRWREIGKRIKELPNDIKDDSCDAMSVADDTVYTLYKSKNRNHVYLQKKNKAIKHYKIACWLKFNNVQLLLNSPDKPDKQINNHSKEWYLDNGSRCKLNINKENFKIITISDYNLLFENGEVPDLDSETAGEHIPSGSLRTVGGVQKPHPAFIPPYKY